MDIKEERQKIFNDVYSNRIPKRVPINVSLTMDVISGYKKLNRKDVLWNPELVYEAANEIAQMIFTDVNVFGGNPRYPSQAQAMGSINNVMSSNGMMQHPNSVGLLQEEYDRFIEDPYACIWEVIIPRLYKELDYNANPARAMFALYQGMQAKAEDFRQIVSVSGRLSQQYGYYSAPMGSGAACYAPMDFVSDNIRSFSGMSTDIRRCPEKVQAAAEAVYAYNYMIGNPAIAHAEGASFFPLHMPTFMRQKDVEKLWWPTWKRQVEDYASQGKHSRAFCEDDWMRYIDLLDELPVDTRLQFEKGDPKTIKEKLGKKYVITGLYPLQTLLTDTKQQAIDRTKEFLDIMMPNGKFIFGFDKNPLIFEDINLENLIAICETVRDYGVYPNEGEVAGVEFNAADYTFSNTEPFHSRAYETWEQYKERNPETPDSARPRVEKLERDIAGQAYSLLL